MNTFLPVFEIFPNIIEDKQGTEQDDYNGQTFDDIAESHPILDIYDARLEEFYEFGGGNVFKDHRNAYPDQGVYSHINHLI